MPLLFGSLLVPTASSPGLTPIAVSDRLHRHRGREAAEESLECPHQGQLHGQMSSNQGLVGHACDKAGVWRDQLTWDECVAVRYDCWGLGGGELRGNSILTHCVRMCVSTCCPNHYINVMVAISEHSRRFQNGD